MLGGELDGLFNKQDKFSYIADYLAGITNIVHDLKTPSIKQVIYMSSLLVLSGNTQPRIDEDTVPIPKEECQKALLMGEKICIAYDPDRHFRVTILRFSQIYGIYKDQYLENNILTKICKKNINNKEIKIVSNKKHHLLYLDDAVDVIYKAIGKEETTDKLYHVGPLRRSPYSEEEILIILKAKVGEMKSAKVVRDDQELAGQEYDFTQLEQLGFKEKYMIKEKIEQLYHTIRLSQRRGRRRSKHMSIITRLFKMDGKIKNNILPYVENLIFFIALNIFIYLTQSIGLHEVIDVYLLYIIVIGVIYGYEQSIFTVILSVIAKGFIATSWDVRVLNFTNYAVYMWILELFTVGVLVGYLKEKYTIKYLDMRDKTDYLEMQLNDVREINQKDQEIKNLYEERLVNYKDSFGRIYKIVSELDVIEPKGIIFKSIGVIEEIMDTKDVSIYILSGKSGFFRLVASSSQKAKTLKNSLRTTDHQVLFEKLEKKQMYINTTLDPGYPMMAEGIYKGQKLESIIMVWSLPFANNNLYEMNIFRVACRLIESSLKLAYEYIQNIKKPYNSEADNVLDKESFSQVAEVYKYGVEEGIVEFHIMSLKRSINMTPKDFFQITNRSIRETDYIGVEDQDHLHILLTNTNHEESAPVIRRLEESGIWIEKGGSLV